MREKVVLISAAVAIVAGISAATAVTAGTAARPGGDVTIGTSLPLTGRLAPPRPRPGGPGIRHRIAPRDERRPAEVPDRVGRQRAALAAAHPGLVVDQRRRGEPVARGRAPDGAPAPR